MQEQNTQKKKKKMSAQINTAVSPEHPLPLTTLCYICKDDQYLMIHRTKKEKDVNKDKWLGIGGHFEEGESPEECLFREVWEETRLTLTRFQFRGLVTFQADDCREYMCLYTADGFTGEMVKRDDCAEGILEWVDVDQVEKLNIWEGDKIFFRLLREGRPFFSLKLRYEGDELKEAALDGVSLALPYV